MKKLALIVCALMLIGMVACTTDDGNVDDGNNGDIEDNGNNGNNVGDEIEDDIDDALDDENTGANANNGDNADEQTLTGSAQGYGGEVTVTVKVNGDDILSVEAVGEDETEGVGTMALEQLPDKIAEADSTDVDSISGATYTSEAIKEAVDEALQGNNQSKD